mmetsp:Transcript_51611/g.59021  ORF Transcript_51611/g.59021 Transcript_51611/m.59021 type:complete len:87 (-) Transcript_51611:37-297(-)
MPWFFEILRQKIKKCSRNVRMKWGFRWKRPEDGKFSVHRDDLETPHYTNQATSILLTTLFDFYLLMHLHTLITEVKARLLFSSIFL